jgi:hypothetical protein
LSQVFEIDEGTRMPVDPKVKRQWQEVQKEYGYPVDVLGCPIDLKDKETLKTWWEEGLDRFMKR